MGRLMTRRENNFKQNSCHGVDLAGNPVSEWEYLNNFFKRYNKVLWWLVTAAFATFATCNLDIELCASWLYGELICPLRQLH